MFHSLSCVSIAAVPCIDGDVRIRGGLSPSNGWVEVCYNQVWGSVCDMGLNQSVAADICEKANFTGEGEMVEQFLTSLYITAKFKTHLHLQLLFLFVCLLSLSLSLSFSLSR